MLDRELTYRVPFERLMKLSRSMSRKAFGPIWWAMWAWVGAFLVACLLAPSIERHPGLRDWPKGVTFVILLAVFFAGLWLILVLSRKQSRKRADYDGEARFRQDSGGLRIATNDIEYYLKWRGIAQVLIEPDGLVVSHGNLFFLVPNTAFASLAERDALIREIFRNLGPDAKDRSIAHVRPLLASSGEEG